MRKDLSGSNQFVLIGDAAERLGVSVDTVRRWNKAGRLNAVRLDGKNRYFLVRDLERLVERKQYKVSEVASKLGISASTLRRREAAIGIQAKRGEHGERLYSDEDLKGLVQERPRKLERLQPVQVQPVVQTVPEGAKFDWNRLSWQIPLGLFVALFMAMVSSTMVSVWLMQNNLRPQITQEPMVETSKVLAAADTRTSLWSRISQFWQRIGSGVVREEAIVRQVENVDQVFEIKVKEGEETLVPKKALEIPMDFLVVDDGNLIENLNAEMVDGKKPGTIAGDLVFWGENNRIEQLRVGVSELLSASVGGEEIIDGSITAVEIADATITAAKLAAGVGGVPNDDAVTTAKIKDATIGSADIGDGAVEGSEIGDNTVSASDLAGTLTFADGDFVDLANIDHSTTDKMGLRLPNVSSASPASPASGEGYVAWDTSGNQIVVFDGSSWGVVTGGGGSGDITSVTAGAGLTGGGVSSDVTLTIGAGSGITVNADEVAINLTTSGTTGSTASSSGLEVSAGGLTLLKGCVDGQILEYTDAGGWACGDDTTGGGGGSNVVEEGDVTVDATVTNFDFLAADFVVGETPEDEVNISIDYTNSKIVRSDQSETISSDWTFNLAETEDLAVNISISGTSSGQGETVTLTNSSSSGSQYGLYLDNAASTGVTESLLVVDNSDTDTAVTNAIEIVIAGGTGFTNILNINGTGLSASELTLLDSGVALSELTDSGTLTVTTGDINGGNIDGTAIGSSSPATGSFTTVAANSDVTLTLAETEDLAVNISISGTSSGQGETVTLTNSSSSGNQYGLYLDNAASSGITEALLVLDNSDADTVVTSAMQFVVGGGTGFTNLFDVNGTLITTTEFTVLDGGIALSELTDSGTLTVTTVDINGGNIDGTTVGGTTAAAGTFTNLTAGGTINFADAGGDTITLGDSNDTLAIASTGVNITSGGAVSGVSTMAVSSDLTLTLAETEDLAVNISFSGTSAGQGEKITVTNSSSSGNQYALYLDNAASTGVTDSLLVIDNSDTDTVVTNGIEFVIAGGTGFTNVLNINGTGLAASELTLLDSGVVLSELTDSGTLTVTTVDINGGNIDGTTVGGTTAAAGTFTNLTAGGTINFADAGADTITLGDTNDALSIGSTGLNVTTAGAMSGVTTLASSGDWTWSATTPTITINDGESLTITDASTPDSFTINTSGSSFSFSDGTNSFTFDVDSGPVYAGNARPTKKVVLTPEYPGATLTGDGSSNTGTMTADNMTSTPYRNYYKWTTNQGSNQDYDIWIKVPLPADWAAMAGTPTLSIDTFSSDTANGTIAVTVYDTSNSADCTATSFTPSTTSTWETKTATTCLDTGTYTAGGVMTIQVKMQSPASGDVRVGTISFDYLAKF